METQRSIENKKKEKRMIAMLKQRKRKEYYVEFEDKVHSLSVEGLKSMIHELGGDDKTCIERSELGSCLSSLIQVKIDSLKSNSVSDFGKHKVFV
jgi:hypothetical protein